MISIIIPALNEEVYIKTILRDLSLQSKIPGEIIVVDSSSDEKTRKAAEQYKKSLPLLIIKSKKNVSLQRNLGAKRAKGNLLMFLDADIHIVGRDFLLKVENMQRKVIFPKIKIQHPNFSEKMAGAVISLTMQCAKLLGIPTARAGCMIIDKLVFEKVKGFNENLRVAEDVDLARRLKSFKPCCSSLIVYESPRRYRKQGVIKTLFVWTIQGLSYFFGKNQRSYEEIR